MFRVGVITISDSSSEGKREDLSGPVIVQMVTKAGYAVSELIVIPDEYDKIVHELSRLADEDVADLVLTTGGTGFSPRDLTPEATLKVCHRLAPGIAEAMRAHSLSITPRAMLSRACAGIREGTLIVNLPGSPKAVRECLEYILPTLGHGLEILRGTTSNCGR